MLPLAVAVDLFPDDVLQRGILASVSIHSRESGVLQDEVWISYVFQDVAHRSASAKACPHDPPPPVFKVPDPPIQRRNS